MTAAGLRLYMPTPAVDRRFVVLALLSLLLHGSLLALLSWPRPPAAPPLPLLATLRLVPLPESGTSAVAPAPAALPPKVRQSLAGAEARPSPPLSRTAGPAIVPVPAEAVAAASAATVTVPAAVAAADSVAASPVVQPAEPAADLLAAYRRRLGELLAGRQDYPRVAALRGWEGEVRLRLRVARKGNLVAVALERSSGFNVLDQHALALLADLGSLPPLPDGLDGNEVQVIVPITYKLNKTT